MLHEKRDFTILVLRKGNLKNTLFTSKFFGEFYRCSESSCSTFYVVPLQYGCCIMPQNCLKIQVTYYVHLCSAYVSVLPLTLPNYGCWSDQVRLTLCLRPPPTDVVASKPRSPESLGCYEGTVGTQSDPCGLL